jgi:hypothetical protein
MKKQTIEVGDYITFKVYARYASGKYRRKVVAITDNGFPCVRFGGWSNFIVYKNDVLKVEKAAANV